MVAIHGMEYPPHTHPHSSHNHITNTTHTHIGALLPPRAEDEAPTLDHIMEHTGISHQELDQQATSDTLAIIAPHIPNWQAIASSLGVPHQETLDIDANKSLDVSMKALSVLNCWLRRNGFRATYRHLVNKCLMLDNAQLAEHVCRIVSGK